MKKQVEILSMILAVGALVGLGIVALGSAASLHPIAFVTVPVFVLHLGSAVWLFQEPDPKKSTAGVWALLGALTGLLGVMLWFLAEINRSVAQLAENGMAQSGGR